MLELKKENRSKLDSLFQNPEDSLIISYLQGYGGHGIVDNLENPECGKIIYGGFCFINGNAKSSNAKELLYYLPEGIHADETFIVGNDDWNQLIESTGDFTKMKRFHLKHEEDVFDKANLNNLINKLPEGYRIERIDKELYTRCMSESWSYSFCMNFKDGDEFTKKGIGFVILHGDEIVCGASSYTVYNEGIEVEIVTRDDYRRKGLATICGAKLILHCVEQGKYPCWDAANMYSVAIAEKLGYHFDEEYIVWIAKNK